MSDKSLNDWDELYLLQHIKSKSCYNKTSSAENLEQEYLKQEYLKQEYIGNKNFDKKDRFEEQIFFFITS